MIRVFLLDDHEVVRRGLAALLESTDDITVVGESGSAKEAARIIPALRPDVAVLDQRLPDGTGVDVCRDVRSQDPTIKALMLDLVPGRRGALQRDHGGGVGLPAQAGPGHRPRRGHPHAWPPAAVSLDPAVTQRVLERIRTGGDREPAELAALTAQERRILELVAQGLTNRQIGAEMFLAEKTVKNYVSSLLAKLGLERRTQAAVLANKLLGH